MIDEESIIELANLSTNIYNDFANYLKIKNNGGKNTIYEELILTVLRYEYRTWYDELRKLSN